MVLVSGWEDRLMEWNKNLERDPIISELCDKIAILNTKIAITTFVDKV